ncbi:hypothetical protein ACFQZ4_03170 [Catellatospora coxensis]
MTEAAAGGRAVLPTRVYANGLSIAAFGTATAPVSVAADVADALGVRVGDTLSVVFADGNAERLTIAKLTPTGRSTTTSSCRGSWSAGTTRPPWPER